MKRAIGLVRVSTEDQKEIGYGIPEQVEKILEHIDRHGYKLIEETGFATDGIEYRAGFFQEDYTGKTVLRPAITALQEAITKHHIQVAIIHRTNRLGRLGSVQEIIEASLQAQGVEVEYVNARFDTSTPIGRAMRRISGVFDQLDYENLIYQLAEGKAQAVKQGSVIVTRPPYGYEAVKVRGTTRKTITVLRIIEEEAAIVEMIYHWYLYGDTDGVPLSIMPSRESSPSSIFQPGGIPQLGKTGRRDCRGENIRAGYGQTSRCIPS
jgi:site-specific DNA recombinase